MDVMDALKIKFTMPPVLALPRLDGYYTIDTDACDAQVGRVQLQKQESKVLKPVGYWSRSDCVAERRYNTTHKE